MGRFFVGGLAALGALVSCVQIAAIEQARPGWTGGTGGGAGGTTASTGGMGGAPDTCSDKMKDGQETDVDCGGPVCPTCATGKACKVLTDCTSALCVSGKCAEPVVWQNHYPATLFRGIGADTSGNAIIAGSYSGTVDFGGGPLTSGTSGADCVVLKVDTGGKYLWGNPFHGTNQRLIADLTVFDDSYQATQGNVAVVGSFQGSLDLTTKTLLCAGSSNAFAIELDTAGNLPSFAPPNAYGNATADARAVAMANGYVAMAGMFSGSIDFGSKMYTSQTTFTSQSTSGDLYVGELTPGIKLLWGKSFTGPLDPQTVRIAVDKSHNVILAGSFRNFVDFGGGKLYATNSSQDVFVAKFDVMGNYVWANRYGDGQDQIVNAVVADSSGNIVLVGTFAGALDFGSGPALVSGGVSNAFIVKLDQMGKRLWSATTGDAYPSNATDVSIDPAGAVIVPGYFQGKLNLGGNTLMGAGGNDIFVVKYDGGGNFVWSTRYGDSANQQPSSGGIKGVVAVDANTILLGGTFGGVLDFGGGAMVSKTGNDIFAVKLLTP